MYVHTHFVCDVSNQINIRIEFKETVSIKELSENYIMYVHNDFVCEVRNQINNRDGTYESGLIKEQRSQNMKCNIYAFQFIIQTV